MACDLCDGDGELDIPRRVMAEVASSMPEKVYMWKGRLFATPALVVRACIEHEGALHGEFRDRDSYISVTTVGKTKTIHIATRHYIH